MLTDASRARFGLGLTRRRGLARQARLQLAKLGARPTELTDDQAQYIGVAKQGPYKAETYRG